MDRDPGDETTYEVLTPARKAPVLEQFLEQNFGRSSAITEGTCVPKPIGCGRPITNFEQYKEIEIREYRISGLCRDCQREIFGD